jgi:NAD(P)-dependent dehydrogenase (short-subunit alcohol dehydrogenase family)
MKTVIITGASGNLGKACVEKFLQEGYRVIATTTPGKTLGFEVNGTIETWEADLTDEASAEEVIARIIAQHTTIDAALLLVGGYASGGIKETDNAALRKMFTLNFNTAYFVARPLFQQMLQQPNGGRIIFVGSRPALIAKDGKRSLGYSLSKSLLFKLADVLNEEGSSSNVTASVVVPSTIDTPANRQSIPKADFTTWVRPEEIADAMAHICSPASNAWRNTVVKVYGRA